MILVQMGESGRVIAVDLEDKDQARSAAYRLVHGKREEDYNELVHSTRVITPEPISRETANALLRFRG